MCTSACIVPLHSELTAVIWQLYVSLSIYPWIHDGAVILWAGLTYRVDNLHRRTAYRDEGCEGREQTEDGSNATLWMPAGIVIEKEEGNVFGGGFPLQTLRKNDSYKIYKSTSYTILCCMLSRSSNICTFMIPLEMYCVSNLLTSITQTFLYWQTETMNHANIIHKPVDISLKFHLFKMAFFKKIFLKRASTLKH